MKNKLMTMLCTLALLLGMLQVSAAKDTVLVGLYYDSTALSRAAISSGDGLASYPSFPLGTDIQAVYDAGSNSITLYDGNGQNVLGKGESGQTITISAGGDILKIQDKRYRGSLQLTPASGGIRVVNDVSLEKYLYGVVPKEAVSSWPAEALKAQAVVARSLVFSALKDKHKSQGFELCATTNCQVYGGYDAETSATNAAVDATAGQIAIYEGKAAHTLYSAANGGYTESSENVWGGSYPYLRSFKDEYEETDLVKGLTWTVEVTPEEIAQGAKRYGGDVGQVTGMRVLETAPSGRVTKLEITGTAGTCVLEKEKTRSFLNLRSQLYTIAASGAGLSALTSAGIAQVQSPSAALTAGGTEAVADAPRVLTASGVETAQAASGGSYVISGRGYGHGVGMSQWGAEAMSEKGFTYQQIIEYYFPGVLIDSLNTIA